MTKYKVGQKISLVKKEKLIEVILSYCESYVNKRKLDW